MKTLFSALVALLFVHVGFAQEEISGKSNTVHLDVGMPTTVETKSSKPIIVWLSPEQTSSAVTVKKMTIKVGINCTVKLRNVTLYLNGVEPTESRGLGVTSPDASKFDQYIEQEVEFSAGTNELKVVAENEKGEITTESRIVNVTLPVLASSTRTDYALIIATNQYSEWNDLTNPVFDALTIADELRENYGFKVDTVINPTKSQILKKIIEYNSKNYLPDDQLFIFIAGHGKFDEIIKDGYIVCKDSKKDDVTSETYIPYSYLRTAIDNSPCRHIFLALDACFGGTFDQAIAKRGEDDDPYSQESAAEYIAKKLKYKTRIYLTSGGKEYVPDGRPGKHSPFAFYFIDALRSYGGHNKVLTTQQIWLNVERVQPEPKYGTFGDNEPGSEFVFQAQ